MPESLEGGLDVVVDEGVDGRPVDFGAAGGGGCAGDLRERNGEIADDRWDLLEVENIEEELDAGFSSRQRDRNKKGFGFG